MSHLCLSDLIHLISPSGKAMLFRAGQLITFAAMLPVKRAAEPHNVSGKPRKGIAFPLGKQIE